MTCALGYAVAKQRSPSTTVQQYDLQAQDAAIPHLVVLGGGFGGLWATRALRGAALRITLVDRCNHHLFQPLLYQVATAGLSAPDIAAPLRHILRQQANAEVRLAQAASIDTARRCVAFSDGTTLGYDL